MDSIASGKVMAIHNLKHGNAYFVFFPIAMKLFFAAISPIPTRFFVPTATPVDYVNHQIIPAVETIFAVFGITREALAEGKRQTTLF